MASPVEGIELNSDLQWYAVNTRNNHEKRVAGQLREHQLETFLPLYHCRHKWRNGVCAELDLPFFPSYLFVRMSLQSRLRVLNLPGVIGLAASSTRPTVLPDDEIEALRLATAAAGAQPHAFLYVGERVRVTAGPLTGVEGILARRKQELRLVLSVELIMRSVAVEVSEYDVEPVSPRRIRSAEIETRYHNGVA
jgi:transcription antitermination factor NusG